MFVRIHTAFKKITVSQWVLVVLSLMAFGASIGSWFITPPDGRNADWWTSWLQNFSTEMFGAITTFILFELIVGRSEKAQARLQEIQRQKADILRRLRSGDLAIVRVALEEAQAEGWLQDGTLANADLGDANLEGMNLKGANLARVDLAGANLRHAKLDHANLEGANIGGGTLESASLMSANLTEANLYEAHLVGTQLANTNLTRANLDGATLRGCYLRRTTLEEATLPDGTTWTTETDMGRFTDDTHPHFFDTEEVPF